MYLVKFTKRAEKDKRLLKEAKLDKQTKKLLDILAVNPFQTPPSYEKLVWDLRGNYSRRINDRHRLVYEIYENDENLLSPDGTPYQGIVKIVKMWSHYE